MSENGAIHNVPANQGTQPDWNKLYEFQNSGVGKSTAYTASIDLTKDGDPKKVQLGPEHSLFFANPTA